MQSTVLLTAHSSIKLLPELKPVVAVQRRLRVTSGRAAAEGLQCVSAPFQVHRRLQHICILLMFHLKQDQSKHKVSLQASARHRAERSRVLGDGEDDDGAAGPA